VLRRKKKDIKRIKLIFQECFDRQDRIVKLRTYMLNYENDSTRREFNRRVKYQRYNARFFFQLLIIALAILASALQIFELCIATSARFVPKEINYCRVTCRKQISINLNARSIAWLLIICIRNFTTINS